MNNQNEGAYIFLGNSLLVPEGTDDILVREPVSPEKVEALVKKYSEHQTDFFSVPALDGPRKINAVTLYDCEAPAGWKALPVRQAVSAISAGTMVGGEGLAGRMLRAFHVSQWRRESRFCGSCGSPNRDAEKELARKCPHCGRLEFPRISPAIITVITNDKDEALLAHNKKFAGKMYALIAGFNEAGESLEATVAREVREEVSIEVKDIRYIVSQPWPFPNSLMLGFSARHAGGGIKPDGVEIEDAQWFSRNNLPELPATGSVSRYLIDLWLQKKL